MAFNLATAKPVGGFDLSTATPVDDQPDVAQAHSDRGLDIAPDIGGLLKGASDIGSTLLWPLDAAKDALSSDGGNLSDQITGNKRKSSHEQRRAALEAFFKENTNPESPWFKGGELAADVAGTAGAGGVLAKGAEAIPMLSRFAPALASGGFDLGGAKTGSTIANLLMRGGAGAATGAASAGLINPEHAGTGATWGAVLPGAVQAAGKLGEKLGPAVSPEVQALYQKAKDAGIDIPIDRLMNSRAMNAVAASLNYIPFSGRAGTEDAMLSGLNRAAAKTMGQDSSNIPQALSGAKAALGGEFDRVLQGNSVNFDEQLATDLANAKAVAKSELVPSQARIITGQIDDIIGKGSGGSIDGQAAYNIKRTLDRIAKRNSPEAHYAGDVRNKIIEALNRSLGPEEAAAFKTTRQQYGNMKAIERMAPNGAEGEITAGRLGGMRGARTPELQNVADIAAQFVKTRESPHGALQRIMMGLLSAGGLAGGAATGTLPAIVGGMAAGRGINSALNSDVLKKLLMDPKAIQELLSNPALRTLPEVIGAGQ